MGAKAGGGVQGRLVGLGGGGASKGWRGGAAASARPPWERFAASAGRGGQGWGAVEALSGAIRGWTPANAAEAFPGSSPHPRGFAAPAQLTRRPVSPSRARPGPTYPPEQLRLLQASAGPGLPPDFRAPLPAVPGREEPPPPPAAAAAGAAALGGRRLGCPAVPLRGPRDTMRAGAAALCSPSLVERGSP